MTLPAGTRLGHYEIVAPIGAGGMGQVYRARDTRLDRTVAIKVLPDSFASNAQLVQRFEREAKVISSLSHANICTLHDVGSHDGIEFLVMEHLDGQTLADRVARGPLPLADVFRYAIEIAEALTTAHRAGVIHRDLKPANVMITRSGAKLLDFGLAKVARPGSTDVTAALEATQRRDDLTSEGTILGTYQYMSPEQLEGADADARSDLFAFGALLYEMLTGKRAFGGKTRASVIASILAAEPPAVSQLRPVTPSGLERLVHTCLAKDPDERWQSAYDVKLELESLRLMGDAPVTAKARTRSMLPWAVATLALLVAAGVWLAGRRGAAMDDKRPLFAQLEATGYHLNVSDGPAVISPDGRSVVARGQRLSPGLDDHSAELLVVRRLDSPEFEMLEGTENAIDPFWSPDSTQIAFFKDARLMRIAASGGPITPICGSAGDPRGGTWSGDTILFSPAPGRPLQRVNAAGGTPVEVGKLDRERGEIGQWRPHFLPDGRHFVYTSMRATADQTGIYVAALDQKERPRKLIDAATTAIFAPSGWLLYAYSGDLLAQQFDAVKLEKSGSPRLVVRKVEYTPQYGSAAYSASRDGTIVYQTRSGDSKSNIVALAKDGSQIAVGIDGSNIDLSRDETRLAMERTDSAAHPPDLWVYDLKRRSRTRLTNDDIPDLGPVWSPDGAQIAYVTQMTGYFGINVRSSSGAGGPKEITRSATGLEITDWSRDGRYLLAEVFNDGTGSDIEVIDLTAPAPALRPLVASRFTENSPRFSPDGRFVSYQSNESGQFNLYVQTFPAVDQRWQVTSDGGVAARWNAAGTQLFYINANRRVAMVRIDASDGLNFSAPELFGTPISQDVTHPTSNGTMYATGRDTTSSSVTLRTNWEQTLAK